MQADPFDTLVIGGGLFGCYTALYLAGRGERVLLVEREAQLLEKASLVNQARLHSGYHYPRSVATARMSDENKLRFTEEHRPFVLTDFEKYYAIDRYNSLTDALQFERFCRYLGLPCERVYGHPLFNYGRLEAVYRTVEHTFDPVLIGQYYRERLAATANIEVRRQAVPTHAAPAGSGEWMVELRTLPDDRRSQVHCTRVVNATYAGTNAVNRLFGLPELALMHEIAEVALVTSPQLGQTGLTVMDGPFGSLMPYGLSGLLSLTSVAYTHHEVSYEAVPNFGCRSGHAGRTAAAGNNCSGCNCRPASNYAKMAAQMRQYLAEAVELHYFGSLFTVKSKLQASYIDDGRPTAIMQLRENPAFYCIFAGKINSIYEIEKVIG